MGAVEYRKDEVVRTEVFDAIQDLFDEYDLLVTPTLAVPPFDNADDGNTLGPAELNGEEVDPLIGWCLTYPINFTGHPAASVPAGSTGDGLRDHPTLLGDQLEPEPLRYGGQQENRLCQGEGAADADPRTRPEGKVSVSRHALGKTTFPTSRLERLGVPEVSRIFVHGPQYYQQLRTGRHAVTPDLTLYYGLPAHAPRRRVQAHGLLYHHLGVGQPGQVLYCGRDLPKPP
jgi:hypothetical protein